MLHQGQEEEQLQSGKEARAASVLNSSSRQRRIYSLSLLQPPHNYTRNPTPLIITSQATSFPLVPHKEVYFVPGVFKWKKNPSSDGISGYPAARSRKTHVWFECSMGEAGEGRQKRGNMGKKRQEKI